MMHQVLDLSNYYYNPWAIPVFIVACLSFLITVFVWSKNKRSLVNISYCLACLCVSIWLFATVGMFSSREVPLGLLWNKINWLVIPFISISVYFYSVMWLGLEKQKKIVLIGYIVAFCFAVLAFTSKHFIAGGRIHFWGVYPEYGVLSYPFLLFHFGMMIASFLNFVNGYRRTDLLIRKKQIRYIFLAYITAYMASVDYVPAFKIEIYPFGYIFVFLWLGIMIFTIIRYKVMEIETVIHRTVLWVISSMAVFIPIIIIIYFIRDMVRDLSRFNLSLLLTFMFFGIVYYYKWVQPRIDHAFRRRKYDYYKVLDEIGQKIGSELDLSKITARLFKELKEVLYIRNAILLVKLPGEKEFREAGRTGYENLLEVKRKEKALLLPDSSLYQWISRNRRALEKEQIMINPLYRSIRQEALAWLDQLSIEVLIPIIMEDKVTGLVGIGKKENLQAYTNRDVELLEKMGNQIGVTIDNGLHHQDIVEKERIAEELRLGRQIQIGLLPQEMPEIPHLFVKGLMQPAKEIGGDYFDFITLTDKERLGIVIGDVSGKGLAAGLLMAMVKTAIHIFSQKETSPRQVLLDTSEALDQHMAGEKFMTLLYLIWDAQNYSITYSSAGHEHILVFRSGTGEIETIRSGKMVLGKGSSINDTLKEQKLNLKKNDKILLYTDGVIEAQNQAREKFGEERLLTSFRKHSPKSSQDLMGSIKDDVYSFIGAYPQYDDITLVVLEAR